eukprot:6204668-Pleurochrysis_carterae.AAC.1
MRTSTLVCRQGRWRSVESGETDGGGVGVGWGGGRSGGSRSVVSCEVVGQEGVERKENKGGVRESVREEADADADVEPLACRGICVRMPTPMPRPCFAHLLHARTG